MGNLPRHRLDDDTKHNLPRRRLDDGTKHKLARTTFKTSRLLEFTSRRELVTQTGQAVETWPLVILKEIADNALDECEEANVAPIIKVAVSTTDRMISITDNGRGMPPEIVESLLDF